MLHRQLDGQLIQFQPADRALLAALLHTLPRPTLHGLRLLVRPETVLRWHRSLIARHHAAASRPKRPGPGPGNDPYHRSLIDDPIDEHRSELRKNDLQESGVTQR